MANRFQLTGEREAHGDHENVEYHGEVREAYADYRLDEEVHVEVPVVRLLGRHDVHVEHVQPVRVVRPVQVPYPDLGPVQYQRARVPADQGEERQRRAYVRDLHAQPTPFFEDVHVVVLVRHEPETGDVDALPYVLDVVQDVDHFAAGEHEVVDAPDVQDERGYVVHQIVQTDREQQAHAERQHPEEHDHDVVHVVTQQRSGVGMQHLVQAHVFGQLKIEHVIVLLALFHFDHCSSGMCVRNASPVDRQSYNYTVINSHLYLPVKPISLFVCAKSCALVNARNYSNNRKPYV